MPAWLAHFTTLAARIDAVVRSAPVPAKGMPPEVLVALIDGNLTPVEDQLEDLPAWGEPERPARERSAPNRPMRPLAEDPIRAMLLASLCQAFPNDGALAALGAVGALTVLRCPPDGLNDDIEGLLKAMPCLGDPRRCVQISKIRRSLDRSDTDGIRTLRRMMAAASQSTAPQILIIEDGAVIPKDMSVLLPPPVRIGGIDRASIAGALSLRGGGYDGLLTQLPENDALRRMTVDQLRFALRHRIRATQLLELNRIAAATRSTDSPTLDDIVGYGDAAIAARRLVADLTAWGDGRIPWSAMTRAILLHGEPGTGKTWLARATAASAGVPLIEGSMAAWQAAGHLGDLLREMRATFARAQAAAPSILLLDEIDSVGDRGSTDHHAATYRRQVINAMLELMDGATQLEGVVIIATCNDPQALDPALRRPGRIDRLIRVPRPGRMAIVHILSRHLMGDLAAVDIDDLARRAIGRSAADIDGAVRDARSSARAADRPLRKTDLVVSLGLEDEDPATLHRVAIHEAGHAIVGSVLNRGTVREIRVAATGGHVHFEPVAPLVTARDLADHMALLLAGRAAEELYCGEGSIGAGNGAGSDLAQATTIALRLELTYGLSRHGLIHHADPAQVMARDPDVRTRAERQLRLARLRARRILTRQRSAVLALADQLCAERVIEGGVDETVGGDGNGHGDGDSDKTGADIGPVETDQRRTTRGEGRDVTVVDRNADVVEGGFDHAPTARVRR